MSTFNRKEWANKEAEHVAKYVTMKYGNNIPMTKCYETVVNEAVKIFNELEDLQHTEESKVMIKRFLSRLIEDKPLSPIEDEDDMWDEVGDNPVRTGEDSEVKLYINKRLRSLYRREVRDIKKDVLTEKTYHDSTRVTCVNIINGEEVILSPVNDYVDEYFPIKFPYFPTDKYVVEVIMFNHKNPLEDGGEDTISIETIIDPDHRVTFPGAYYALNEDHEKRRYHWCKIDSPEYYDRLHEYRKNKYRCISKKPEATTGNNERSSQDSI